MATNIEMNILTSTGKYETLYPKTTISQIEGALSTTQGVTGKTTAAAAMYDMIVSPVVRSADDLDSYASDTYIPCYDGTTSYRFPLSYIMDYINANVSLSTFTVAKGGTGKTTHTANYVLVGNGTGVVTNRAITNNTVNTGAISASTNLVTMNTLRYALNRTTGINSADTNYGTFMMRGIKAGTSIPSSLTNGCIQVVYEN